MFSPRFGGTGSVNFQDLEEQKNDGEGNYRIQEESPEEEIRRIISSEPSGKKKLEDREELVNFMKCS